MSNLPTKQEVRERELAIWNCFQLLINACITDRTFTSMDFHTAEVVKECTERALTEIRALRKDSIDANGASLLRRCLEYCKYGERLFGAAADNLQARGED